MVHVKTQYLTLFNFQLQALNCTSFVRDKFHYQPIQVVNAFPTKDYRHESTKHPKPIPIDAAPHPLYDPPVNANYENAVDNTSRRQSRRPSQAEKPITHRHVVPNTADVFSIPLPQPNRKVGISCDCDDIYHYPATAADIKSQWVLLLLLLSASPHHEK